MTLTEALDDLERRLDAVHAALDAGEVPDLPDFTPRTITAHPTEDERARFLQTMERLRACQDRLREHRARMLEEYVGLDVRRRAATAYAGDR